MLILHYWPSKTCTFIYVLDVSNFIYPIDRFPELINQGNSLTLSETKVLLENGLTAGGKPFRDACEAVGHARASAFDFILEAARFISFITLKSTS